MSDEIRVCKNKKCQKILPAGYQHRYCEACRNQHVETAKKTLGGLAVTIASGVLGAFSIGKIYGKK